MKPQTQMIINMVNAVQKAHGNTVEEAFDIVLSWVAVHTHVEEQLATPGIQIAALEVLEQEFSLDKFREEKWDWFGEAAIELGLFAYTRTDEEVKEYVEKAVAALATDNKEPQAVLIREVDAGREIILLHDKLPDDTIYFGTQSSLRLYRIAVLNVHLHKLPAQILYADDSVKLDFESMNWRASNLWNPLEISKLKRT